MVAVVKTGGKTESSIGREKNILGMQGWEDGEGLAGKEEDAVEM